MVRSDNDGYEDIFVSGVFRNTLYHNNGDGTFTDVTEKAGLAKVDKEYGPQWSDRITTATKTSLSPAFFATLSITITATVLLPMSLKRQVWQRSTRSTAPNGPIG